MKTDALQRLSRLKNTSEKLELDAGNGQTYRIQKISEKGFRETMEDEDVVFSTSPELNTGKLGQAMVKSITDMSQKVKRLYPKITTGSAVAMVAITPDLKAVCTDLGDSFVVAYVWDSQTKKVTPHVINTQHSAGSQSEFERIKQEGGYVTAEIYEGVKCANLLYPTILTDESLSRIEQIKTDWSRKIYHTKYLTECAVKKLLQGV